MFGIAKNLSLPHDRDDEIFSTDNWLTPKLRPPPILAMVFQTPAGGENVYGFKAGDACWFEGAEDEDGIALARTPAEVLEAGDKPVIRIDEPATHSLCTQWSRLQPLVGRGERCWHIVERGIGRGGVRKNRRVLVELQRAMPRPSVRSVNSEESRPATWGDLGAHLPRPSP